MESSQASAQASAATLEGVRLSAQATLAQSYFQLRALDEQKRLLDDIAAAFKKILDMNKNRYASGVASRNDMPWPKPSSRTPRPRPSTSGCSGPNWSTPSPP